jgi:hypothetical protein
MLRLKETLGSSRYLRNTIAELFILRQKRDGTTPMINTSKEREHHKDSTMHTTNTSLHTTRPKGLTGKRWSLLPSTMKATYVHHTVPRPVEASKVSLCRVRHSLPWRPLTPVGAQQHCRRSD